MFVDPVAISSAMTAPAPGPSWKPCAEKPNWWNTPFRRGAAGPNTGMSSGMLASMPAQARTIVAPRMTGNSSHTVLALVGELGPVEHGNVLVAHRATEMAAADQHRAVGELLEGELAPAQDHHRLDEGRHAAR